MILTTCPLTSTHTSPLTLEKGDFFFFKFHICILVVAGKENSIIFFFLQSYLGPDIEIYT